MEKMQIAIKEIAEKIKRFSSIPNERIDELLKTCNFYHRASPNLDEEIKNMADSIGAGAYFCHGALLYNNSKIIYKPFIYLNSPFENSSKQIEYLSHELFHLFKSRTICKPNFHILYCGCQERFLDLSNNHYAAAKNSGLCEALNSLQTFYFMKANYQYARFSYSPMTEVLYHVGIKYKITNELLKLDERNDIEGLKNLINSNVSVKTSKINPFDLLTKYCDIIEDFCVSAHPEIYKKEAQNLTDMVLNQLVGDGCKVKVKELIPCDRVLVSQNKIEEECAKYEEECALGM